MELDYAFLADAAQVSQGKTFVLGGGVSILWRNQFPAPIGCVLVAQFNFHRTEVDTQHEISVRVMDADGNPVLPEIKGQIMLGKPLEDMPNVPLLIPLVVGFPPVPALQKTGSYSVELLVGGRHLKSLPFAVAHPPSPAPG